MPNGRQAIVAATERRVIVAAQAWARERPWEKSKRRMSPGERELFEAVFILSKARHITGTTIVPDALRAPKPDREPEKK